MREYSPTSTVVPGNLWIRACYRPSYRKHDERCGWIESAYCPTYSSLSCSGIYILCELQIPHNDLSLIVMIPLLLALILVVPLPPTRLLSQNHLPLFPLSYCSSFTHQFYINTYFTISSSPEDILWLYFDSVTAFPDSLLSHWPDGSVRHYILETDLRHYHLSTSLSSSPPPKYTTLSHLFYNLQLLKNLTVDLTLSTALSTSLPMAPPTELPIVSRLVLIHDTTLETTFDTTLILPLALPLALPMSLPTALPIVFRLVVCHHIRILHCHFIFIVLRASISHITHYYIITILLGSKLFFRFLNF